MLKRRYHHKPASLAESGRKPSSLVKSSLESFELSFSSFREDFRLRAVTVFLALCISLHLEPFEHLPVVKNSSHSRMKKNETKNEKKRNDCFNSWSHTGQNYWVPICWDRGHLLLIAKALLVTKRAWLLMYFLMLTGRARLHLSWFPSWNGFWKGISETHRFWV